MNKKKTLNTILWREKKQQHNKKKYVKADKILLEKKQDKKITKTQMLENIFISFLFKFVYFISW